MRNYIKAALFIFLIIGFWAVSLKKASAFNLAEDFNLQDTSRNSIKLSSYKDKQAVLLFFWTSWCPYCRSELKTLNKIYPQLKKDNLEVLSIDAGESPTRVNGFIKSYFRSDNLAYPVLLDINTSVTDAYGVVGVPTYILINKKGYIVFKGHYFPKEEYKDLLKE